MSIRNDHFRNLGDGKIDPCCKEMKNAWDNDRCNIITLEYEHKYVCVLAWVSPKGVLQQTLTCPFCGAPIEYPFYDKGGIQ